MSDGVWYVAHCARCALTKTFDHKHERDDWSFNHSTSKGHKVLHSRTKEAPVQKPRPNCVICTQTGAPAPATANVAGYLTCDEHVTPMLLGYNITWGDVDSAVERAVVIARQVRRIPSDDD